MYNIHAYVLPCNERNISVCCKFTQLHSHQILLKSVNIWLSYCEKQKSELFLKHSVVMPRYTTQLQQTLPVTGHTQRHMPRLSFFHFQLWLSNQQSMPLGFLSPNLCHCPPKWGFLNSQIKVRAGLCIAAKILIPAMHRHMLQHAYCILWVLTCYTLEAAGYATSGAMQLWQLTLQLCQYPSQAQIFDLRHLSEPLTSSNPGRAW